MKYELFRVYKLLALPFTKSDSTEKLKALIINAYWTIERKSEFGGGLYGNGSGMANVHQTVTIRRRWWWFRGIRPSQILNIEFVLVHDYYWLSCHYHFHPIPSHSQSSSPLFKYIRGIELNSHPIRDWRMSEWLVWDSIDDKTVGVITWRDKGKTT